MAYHFDGSLLKTHIVTSEVKRQAQRAQLNLYYDRESKLKDLLLVLQCIDLTTLAGDDSYSNVLRLCSRAQHPLSDVILKKLDPIYGHMTTGAVCVYPLRVADCRKCFDKMNIDDDDNGSSKIPIASVVAGFPCGQSPISSTLNDIEFAANSGATEIDIVINRSLVLVNDWQTLFNEIKIISDECRQENLHLKVILSCGELGTFQNVYKASMCAMMAGAHFIKTSTGKETINAKLSYGLVMIRAINDFYSATGIRVGLKPAGGIKHSNEALSWLNLVRHHLGTEWLTNRLFRIGASSLLDNIETEIFRLIYNRNPTINELSSP